MATYYLDLSEDYADQTGLDNGANRYKGVGGLQAAVRGTGAATALAAGDILYVRNHGDLGRLVVIDTGKDVVAAGWQLTDELADNNTGAEWTGVLCQLSVGGSADVILVELDFAFDTTDIVDASGINNVTRVDATTIDSHSCPGWQWDTNSGDTASGPIRAIGTALDWSTGVGTGYCATLDGESVATNCVYYNTVLRIHCESLIFQNAAAADAAQTGSSRLQWKHCVFESAGGDGNAAECTYSTMIHCVARNNTTDGLDLFSQSQAIHCVATGNGRYGFRMGSGCALVNSLAHDNADDNVSLTGDSSAVVGCTLDGSTGGSGVRLVTGSEWNLVYHCRLSNNADHGVEQDDVPGALNAEDYNVLYNNTNGDRQNITAGANSRVAANAAECGYIDRPNDDFRLTDDAIMAGDDAEDIALDWTSALYPNTGYFTAGVPRIYDLPIPANVRLGIVYDGGYDIGTCAVPAAADVEAGVAVDAGVGTFVVPAVGNVRLATGYGAAGVEFVGTCVVPAVGDVQFGVAVDVGLLGTFVVPAIVNVRLATGYGAGGTEFTGTLVVPAVGDVEAGVAVDAGVGTFVVPLEANVALGIGYGAAGTEFVGTNPYAAGDVTAPGAPTIGFGDTGESSVTIYVTPPSDSDYATTTVQAIPVNGGTIVTASGASGYITVTGLQGGTTYAFVATALDATGNRSTPGNVVLGSTLPAAAPTLPLWVKWWVNDEEEVHEFGPEAIDPTQRGSHSVGGFCMGKGRILRMRLECHAPVSVLELRGVGLRIAERREGEPGGLRGPLGMKDA